ncbi:MAG: bifunctional phosphopantothenoylcysteine decarboxylase/phosphopantothenate--cysteine ligase CoaBC [Paracoccaceae bacterium]
MQGSRILLIVGGGIAAYRALDVAREARRAGAEIVPVMTGAAEQFVTPLSLAALCACPVHRDLFDLTAEAEMGHIELSRSADLVLVCPATASLMARMAHGLADDLASTLLLATRTPVLIAPAMNVAMWEHPATRANLATLRDRGIRTVGPDAGAMACGEWGEGRLSPVDAIVGACAEMLSGGTGVGPQPGPLSGRHVLITSGPTHEAIDPVRYIANRSSGAQGTALAEAARNAGARVTFVTGPAAVPPPDGVAVVPVETARQMRDAVQAALPADVAILAAAVADWHVVNASDEKAKKGAGPPAIEFAENPDILAELSRRDAGRPALVIGFAAETSDVAARAGAKRARKGCDWIVANDVSPATGIMGGAENAVTLIDAAGAQAWPRLPKHEVARRLIARVADALA